VNQTEIAALFQMQPENAIAYLKQKRVTESWDWQDMLDDAHVSAFTIAKSAEMDVAHDIHQAVLKAAETGQTFDDFKRDLMPVLEKKGWVGRQTVPNPDTGEEEEILIENTESRKQLENRNNAMRLLKSQLYDRAMKKRLEAQAKIEAGKKKIEWGSQIRSYVFDDRRVKDHRTNYQTADVDGVMDGKIDDFIKAYLMEFPVTEE